MSTILDVVLVVMWCVPLPALLLWIVVGEWVEASPTEISRAGTGKYSAVALVFTSYSLVLLAATAFRACVESPILLGCVGLPIAAPLLVAAFVFPSRIGRVCVKWDEHGISGVRSVWRTKLVTVPWGQITRVEVPPFQGPRPDPGRYNLDSRVPIYSWRKVFDDTQGVMIDFSLAAVGNELSEELYRRRPELFRHYFTYS